VRKGHQELMNITRNVPHFDLPLEQFTVAKFNELLSFLDVHNCSFTRLLQANMHDSHVGLQHPLPHLHLSSSTGGYSMSARGSGGVEGLLRGRCVFGRHARTR